VRGYRPPPLTRSLFALLAALVLAVGTTEVHSASASHLAGRGFGVQVAEGASHPFEARHIEASENRIDPPCPACLLQLQTVAAGLTLPAVLPVPAGEAAPAAPARARRRSPLLRLGSPRGPPALPVR
jgi:hypothetical protein